MFLLHCSKKFVTRLSPNVRERDGACIDWGVRAKPKAKTAQHKKQQQ